MIVHVGMVGWGTIDQPVGVARHRGVGRAVTAVRVAGRVVPEAVIFRLLLVPRGHRPLEGEYGPVSLRHRAGRFSNGWNELQRIGPFDLDRSEWDVDAWRDEASIVRQQLDNF